MSAKNVALLSVLLMLAVSGHAIGAQCKFKVVLTSSSESLDEVMYLKVSPPPLPLT